MSHFLLDVSSFASSTLTDEDTLKAIGKLGKEPMCNSAMRGWSTSWNLGTPFLQSYYTIFQSGEQTTGSEVGEGTAVGFAQAVCSK